MSGRRAEEKTQTSRRWIGGLLLLAAVVVLLVAVPAVISAAGTDNSGFQVTINETASNTTAVPGENVTVSTTINNTEEAQTQNLNLTINNTTASAVVNQTTLELDENKNTTVDFTWSNTSEYAPGDYEATVFTENNSETTDITLQEPIADFRVNEFATDDSVIQGDDLDVAANITNVGNITDTQTVNLTVSNESTSEVAATSLTLDPDQQNSSVPLNWTNTSEFEPGEYKLTVNTENSSKNQSVDLLKPATFSVSNITTTSPVAEGENLTAEVDIENSGDAEGSQVVELKNVSGEVADSETVTLNSGATQTVSLNWSTTVGDAGTGEINVTSEDDFATDEVEILRAIADFQINEFTANDSVLQGDDLAVAANITNVGNITETQPVNLNISNGVDQAVTTTDLTLDAGQENSSVPLNWTNTSDFDPGNYHLTVATENTTESQPITVLDPVANFTVDIESTNEPIVEGENLTVSANITNTGNVSGEQPITLSADGSEEDNTTVELDVGASEEIDLVWNTTRGDSGTVDLTVDSQNATATETVTVDRAPADFQVEAIDAVDSSITEGDELRVNATIRNVGNLTATQPVNLTVENGDRTEVDTADIELVPDETNTTQFVWPTDRRGDSGDYIANVSTLNATNSTDVTVNREPPSFDVVINDTNEPVVAGTNLTAEINVSNAGNQTGTQELTLIDITGTPVANTTVEVGPTTDLDGPENVTVTDLNWSTAETDAGSGEINVTIADDVGAPVNAFNTTSVTVLEPPFFDITAIQANATAAEVGETISVESTINNTGEATGTQNTTLSYNTSEGSEEVDRTELTLDGETETNRTLNWPIASDLASGDYDLTVRSADTNATETVSITGTETLSGTVSDGVSGTTVENATVTAIPDSGTNVTANTSADGSYELELLNSQPYTVTTEAEALDGTTISETVDLTITDETTEDLTLFPTLSGSGVQGDPFLVSTAYELQTVGENVSADYRLTADIEANATASWNNQSGVPLGFDPIGTSTTPFSGSFDGNEHLIRNLTVDRPDTDRVGLFGQVGTDGTVDSVGLQNVSVTGRNIVGGVTGQQNGNLSGVWSTGTVSGDDTVGGLVGFMNDASRLKGSYSTAAVGDGNQIGGLVGFKNTDGRIEQTYAAGNVSGSGSVGGLVAGGSGSDRVSQSYWDTNETGPTDSFAGTPVTTDELTGVDSESRAFAFDTNWIATDSYPRLQWEVDDYSLSADTTELEVGQETNATVIAALSDGTTATVTESAEFSTNDSSILTLTPDGKNLSLQGDSSGNVELTASQSGFSDTLAVTVLTEPFFEPRIVGLPSSVDVRESLNVTVNVTNTAQTGGFRDVELAVDTGTGFETQDVNESIQLEPDESAEFNLSWNEVPESISTGSVDVRVDSVDNTTTESIRVNGLETVTATVTDVIADTQPAGAVFSADPADANVSTTDSNGEVELALINGTTYNLTATLPLADGTELANTKTVTVDGSTAVEFDLEPTIGGDGTANNPYRLATAHELQTAQFDPTANYTVVKDIDAGLTEEWNGGAGFVPIGNDSQPFTGSFDGGGHTVSNLSITRSSDSVGLFGVVTADGAVEDISMPDADISGGDSVGAIAGQSDGTLTSVSSTGSVTGGDRVGGLVGRTDGSIQTGYSRATVNGSSSTGGAVGQLIGGSLTDLYVAGTATDGPIYGSAVGPTTTNTYWDVNVTGFAESNQGEALTTDELTGDSVISRLPFAWYDEWVPTDSYPILASQLGLDGNGSAADPYVLTDARELQSVLVDPTANYTLGASINASDTNSLFDGDGFKPLGNASEPFSGSFDGNGETISGLSINRSSTNEVGLFGNVTGTVTGVALRDATITGNERVGAVVGANGGTVTNASADGTVTGADVTGGLVGQNDGTLRDSYALATVDGTAVAGGAVGTNAGPIETSYAAGSVSGSPAGGLIGDDAGGSDQSSYWDSEATGQTTSDGGTDLTTSEMNGPTSSQTMNGFDFDSIWIEPVGERPRLVGELSSVLLSADTDELLSGQTTGSTVDATFSHTPATGTDVSGATAVSYNSSNESVATVTSAGDVVANTTAGTAQITATVGTYNDSTDISVLDAPAVDDFRLENPEGRNLTVSFGSPLDLTAINVSISETETATLNRSNFTREGTLYRAQYAAGADGRYNATLLEASDTDGADAANAETDSVIVNASLPSISEFSATGTENQEIDVSFVSDTRLNSSRTTVTLSGAESGTLTEFTESTLSDGRFEYSGTYEAGTSGEYTVELTEAVDATDATRDGSTTKEFVTDLTLSEPTPALSGYTVTNPSGRELVVSLNSSIQLDSLSVDVSGPDAQTLDLGDFTETTSGGSYTYTSTSTLGSDGSYTVAVTTASANGVDGASSQSETVTLDSSGDGETTQPSDGGGQPAGGGGARGTSGSG